MHAGGRQTPHHRIDDAHRAASDTCPKHYAISLPTLTEVFRVVKEWKNLIFSRVNALIYYITDTFSE
jgi:hypothetical protein